MNIYALLQYDWWVWKGIDVNSLTPRSARTWALNTALYTKSMYLYASGRLYFLSTLFFFLCEMDGFNFLPSHKSTCIWILEFGPLPGLKLRYSSLWVVNVKRQRRKKHFQWSTGSLRDDQREARWSAEHACHCFSSTRQGLPHGVEEFFTHLGELWTSYLITSLHTDLSISTH